jgi:predicted Zn-dependent peptidase
MQLLRKKLKNGITVIMEKRDLPVASFCIANKFGAIFEDSKIKGVAHFIEHLLFTGTKTRTHEDISREIEKRGGILNAFTWHEVTSYMFKLPSEHLSAGMDILIDMLKNSIMNEEKFEKEKKVILEEIKMYHDDPQRSVYEQIEQNLYDKPFGELVIGNTKSVSELKRDFVFDFYKKMYAPSNYVAIVVGNADFDEVCKKLEKSFPVSKEFTHSPIKIVPKNAETKEERKGIDQAHFIFAMHAPKPNTKEYHALQVLNTYLAGGMSSKLFLEIREKRGLAYSVHGHVSGEKSYGYYSIYAGTRKDAIAEVKSLILDAFKKAESITEAELKEAKGRLIGLRKVSLEESMDVMNGLLFQEISSGNAEDYYEFEKRIQAVKLEDVRKAAKIKDYSIAMIVPA